jgi:oligopeptide/dipeptide ABC transporter ATP-binding protein
LSQELLEVRKVSKHFPLTKGLFQTKAVAFIQAVDGVSLSIQPEQTYGLVGESGCGKTTLAKLILLLEKPTAGNIFFEGRDIGSHDKHELRTYRKSVQAVFQDPFSSLNPRMRVGDLIAEPMIINHILPSRVAKERVGELLGQVGLNPRDASLYPHEFSGGQKQRIAIARALAITPKLVVLDEPISALDISIRAQLMNLLKDLQQRFHLTYLLIAHDLAVVEQLSERMGVMYLGKLVEEADSEELLSHPFHPYTVALLSAILPSRPGERRQQIVLKGEVGSPINPPPGCRFVPRCPKAMPTCSEIEPPLVAVSDSHFLACHLRS